MKHIFTIFLLSIHFWLYAGGVKEMYLSSKIINTSTDMTYVPDDVFEQLLIDRGLDDVLDNYVLTSSIDNITSFTIRDTEISDLTGIDGFTSLERLYCYDNQLTKLDLSSNTALRILKCYNNNLTSLDVSNNNVLLNVDCRNNNLTSLIFSSHPEMLYMSCRDNLLTHVDISGLPALTNLLCDDNQLLKLDMSNSPFLSNVTIDGNQLTEVDVPSGQSLTYFDCRRNNLTELDVSNNTRLRTLYCSENQLTSVDVSGCSSLSSMRSEENQLVELDVSTNTALSTLRCYENPNLFCVQVSDGQLQNTPSGWEKDDQTEYSLMCGIEVTYVPDNSFEQALIDLGYDDLLDGYVITSNIESVTELVLNSNQITDLTGIEGFTSLTRLYCNDNQLVELDLSNNLALEYLYCNSNDLLSLNVSDNASLTRLYCNSNEITSLDVSSFSNLIFFQCKTNVDLSCIQVSQDQLDNLGTRWKKSSYSSYSIDCDTFSARKVESSINDVVLANVAKVYPNPALDHFTIDLGDFETANVAVYNMLGKVVLQTELNQSVNQFSTNQLIEGTYIVKVYQNDKVGSHRLSVLK